MPKKPTVQKKDIPFRLCDTIESANANGGWQSMDLPEPRRGAPRPDTKTAGSAGGNSANRY